MVKETKLDYKSKKLEQLTRWLAIAVTVFLFLILSFGIFGELFIDILYVFDFDEHFIVLLEIIVSEIIVPVGLIGLATAVLIQSKRSKLLVQLSKNVINQKIKKISTNTNNTKYFYPSPKALKHERFIYLFSAFSILIISGLVVTGILYSIYRDQYIVYFLIISIILFVVLDNLFRYKNLQYQNSYLEITNDKIIYGTKGQQTVFKVNDIKNYEIAFSWFTLILKIRFKTGSLIKLKKVGWDLKGINKALKQLGIKRLDDNFLFGS